MNGKIVCRRRRSKSEERLRKGIRMGKIWREGERDSEGFGGKIRVKALIQVLAAGFHRSDVL